MIFLRHIRESHERYRQPSSRLNFTIGPAKKGMFSVFLILYNLTSAGNMRPFHAEPNLWFGFLLWQFSFRNYNNGIDFVEYAFLHVDDRGHTQGPWD